ncbi:MAG: hypothetical protein KBT11_05420, partial [Treponema sp.]|nr:hypothetical protein [Candidatus Treponema equifaecale]
MKKLLIFLSILTLFTFLSCNSKNTKKSKNIDFVNHYLSDKDLDALEYPEIKTENFETIKHSYILNNKSVKS